MALSSSLASYTCIRSLGISPTLMPSIPKFPCRASVASNMSAAANMISGVKEPFRPPLYVEHQVSHSMAAEKIEIIKSLEEWAEKSILTFLKPVEKSWQPQDFLPDPSSEGFIEQVEELRQRAKEIPDDYYVCLVGDMVTEEALPNYQTSINNLDGMRDETGASLTSWSIWNRGWTAEENRHGDLLRQYLYLCGRVDMRQIEKTVQYLLGSGMYVHLENHAYRGFIYGSFQERATFISHSNTARQAKFHGDLNLAQICGTIAADEKRHEAAYIKVVEKLFEVDPDETVIAFADMMKNKIVMPAHLMFDGRDLGLFHNFSAVAQRLGVYTAKDYLDILEFLVGRWRVEGLIGLSDKGKKAQDFVCNLAPRFRKLQERAQERLKLTSTSTAKFSWIFDREVQIN